MVCKKPGIRAEAIHGNKSQNQRERVLAAFRDGKLRTLIATDIAARGIDVDGISHVVNYDLPNIPESYVHRIGRTARAGADGVAISFCDNEERAYLRDIERLIRITIPATDRRTGKPSALGASRARITPPIASEWSTASATASPSQRPRSSMAAMAIIKPRPQDPHHSGDTGRASQMDWKCYIPAPLGRAAPQCRPPPR